MRSGGIAYTLRVAAGPALRLVSRCATVEEFVRAFCGSAAADTLEVQLASAPPASGTRGRVVVALANRIAVIDGDAEVTCDATRVTIRYTRLDARSKGLLAHLVECNGKDTIAAVPRHLVPLGAPVGDATTARDQADRAACTAEPLVAAASVPRLPDLSGVPRPTLARGVAVPPVRTRPATEPAPLPRTPRPATMPPPIVVPVVPALPASGAPAAPIAKAPSAPIAKPAPAAPAAPIAKAPSAPIVAAASAPAPAAPVLPEAPAPAKPRRRRETQPTLMGVGTTRRPVEPIDPDTDPSGRAPAGAGGREPRGGFESTFHGPAPMRTFDLAAPAPMDGGLTAPMTAPMRAVHDPHELGSGELDSVSVGDDLNTDVALALPELPGGDDLDPLVDPPAPSSMPRAGLSMAISSRGATKPRAAARTTEPAPMTFAAPAPIDQPPSVELADEPAAPIELAAAASAPPPHAAPIAHVGAEAMPMYSIPAASMHAPPAYPTPAHAMPVYPPPAVGSGTGPAAAHPGAWPTPTPGWSPSAPGYPAPPPQAPPPQPSYQAPPPQQYMTAQLPALDYHPPARSTPSSSSSAWQRHRPEMPEDVGDMTEIVSVHHVRRRRWPVIAITSAIVVAIAIIAIAVASQSSGGGALATDPDGATDAAVAIDPKVVAPPAPEAPTPAPPAPPPPAASGPCRVAFVSSPDGAELVIGGKIAGITPVTLELPCSATAVSFKRDRYQTITRRIEPTPGDHSISVALERPTFSVTVTSVPSGAKIFVAGVAAGVTPGKITVPGFEGTPVELTKSRFASHRERVYATKTGQKLQVRLRRK